MRAKAWCGALAGMGMMLLTANAVVAAQYDHEIKEQKMTFAWKVDGANLAVKISAQTEGWVGVGFNPSKEMKDANFVLGYVKDGKATITDEFGDSETSHVADESRGGSNDVTLVGGSESGGVTTIEFTMPLKSADKQDGAIDGGGENVVLLAYGGGRDSFKTKHNFRTALKVNLATGASQKAK